MKMALTTICVTLATLLALTAEVKAQYPVVVPAAPGSAVVVGPPTVTTYRVPATVVRRPAAVTFAPGTVVYRPTTVMAAPTTVYRPARVPVAAPVTVVNAVPAATVVPAAPATVFYSPYGGSEVRVAGQPVRNLLRAIVP